MTKLHCDNHLIATRIELKDMEKYIYNTCSKKKNLILRKRTIKSIYCTGIYIVHVIASFGFNVNIVWTYQGFGKKKVLTTFKLFLSLIHFTDD